ncbi:MAG: hypothetical protein AB7F99_07880, partial [Vicinamibacterales bacterium]
MYENLKVGHAAGRYGINRDNVEQTGRLERFSFPYSDAIAAVADVVRAFGWGEELEREADQHRDLVEG